MFKLREIWTMVFAVPKAEQFCVFCVMVYRNRCAIQANRIFWEMIHSYEALTCGVFNWLLVRVIRQIVQHRSESVICKVFRVDGGRQQVIECLHSIFNPTFHFTHAMIRLRKDVSQPGCG